MSLESNVQEALKKAMLEKNQAALRTLRAVKSAILLLQTEKGFDGEISSEQEVQLVQKLVKQRKESNSIFEAQNRMDLAEKEQEEIEILQAFLPEQLSEEELTKVLHRIVLDTEANSMKDMGRVIAIANQKLAGKAEGAIIAKVVKNLLQ